MTHSWWLNLVLPGLIVSLPLTLLEGIGLWLQYRALRRHVEKVARRQTAELLGQSGGSLGQQGTR